MTITSMISNYCVPSSRWRSPRATLRHRWCRQSCPSGRSSTSSRSSSSTLAAGPEGWKEGRREGNEKAIQWLREGKSGLHWLTVLIREAEFDPPLPLRSTPLYCIVVGRLLDIAAAPQRCQKWYDSFLEWWWDKTLLCDESERESVILGGNSIGKKLACVLAWITAWDAFFILWHD